MTQFKVSDTNSTFTPNNNKHLFTNIKTKINKDNKIVVDKLNCKDCNNSYIDQTIDNIEKNDAVIVNTQYHIIYP